MQHRGRVEENYRLVYVADEGQYLVGVAVRGDEMGRMSVSLQGSEPTVRHYEDVDEFDSTAEGRACRRQHEEGPIVDERCRGLDRRPGIEHVECNGADAEGEHGTEPLWRHPVFPIGVGEDEREPGDSDPFGTDDGQIASDLLRLERDARYLEGIGDGPHASENE